jgi:hypothetical protein
LRTAGIDLASQPEDTAVCVIDWTDGGAPSNVDIWSASWTDDDLVKLMRDPTIDRVGIDAPFGWPIEYVTAISSYRDHGIWPVSDPDCLRFRATERSLGRGLSPSFDWLVWVVLRCARLLDRYAREEATGFDRTGEGRFVEVYPAAAMERWDISPAKSTDDPGSYKGDKPESIARRQKLVSEIVSELEPIVSFPNDLVTECSDTNGDHLVDAVLAALVARTMAIGNCEPIPSEAKVRAENEGWIRVPQPSRLSESVTGPVPE